MNRFRPRKDGSKGGDNPVGVAEGTAQQPKPGAHGWARVRLAHRKHTRRGSVTIHGDDAALVSRGVALSSELSRRSSSRRPSVVDALGDAGSMEVVAFNIAKRVRNEIIGRGAHWSAPYDERALGSLEYMVSDDELIVLCENACAKRFWCDSSLVEVATPAKVFGDLHGQFADLLRFFDEYGTPEPYGGDVGYVSYLFLGDYVDRGTLSLECVALLLAIKTCHPEQVTLLRGNHEDRDVNADFGFQQECLRRCPQGMRVWEACNAAFEMMPLAAVIDSAILCLHGGLGGSVRTLQQLRELPRPFVIEPEAQDPTTICVYDVLWSDPTENDEITGVRPNQRGEGVVRFGPDRVREFCDANALQLVLRAHECVWDGFEYFAQGQLLTVFSCPDYGGRYANDGAMLVVNRNLEVMPKVICSRHRSQTPSSATPPQSSPTPPPQRAGGGGGSGPTHARSPPSLAAEDAGDRSNHRQSARLRDLEMPHGLTKEVMRAPPDGAEQAYEGALATVHFNVSLLDGTLLHDSRAGDGEALEFTIGKQPSEAVLGWDLVLPGMGVGEIARLHCAPKYAYGERGAPPLIPPNASLVFELELICLRDEAPGGGDASGDVPTADDATASRFERWLEHKSLSHGQDGEEQVPVASSPPAASSTWDNDVDGARPPTPPRARPPPSSRATPG